MSTRREMLFGLALAFGLLCSPALAQPADPLPSWNDGPAKQAILDLVRATTEPGSPDFVAPEARLATFDQDGTLWVEHPIYSQVVFALDRVVALAPEHPEWKEKEPFKTVLSGDREAMAKLSLRDLEEIVFATHAGMTVEAFNAIAAEWAARPRTTAGTALHRAGLPADAGGAGPAARQRLPHLHRHRRRPGLRALLCRARLRRRPRPRSSARRWRPSYEYDAKGQGVLIREPKLELNNNNSGKAEDIYLFTGQRPQAAFGNSTGDRQMLEWTTAGAGKRLGMLVLHDDKEREYAYGPAAGLPDTKVGTFTQALLRRGEAARLGGDQHEGRLEADLRVRAVSVCPLAAGIGENCRCRESPKSFAGGRTGPLPVIASDQQYLEQGQANATATALDRGRFWWLARCR